LTSIVPYFNVFLGICGAVPWKEESNKKVSHFLGNNNLKINHQQKNVFNSNLVRHKSIFEVVADAQNDIYNLHAYDRNNTPIFYDVAYIPNYKNSVYMNSLFRNIKENYNLDLIEESDDEEDFEDDRENKYVDLTKKIRMECVFHNKFKRWVPINVINDKSTKLVYVHNLPELNIL
jgi:hypothetical protein